MGTESLFVGHCQKCHAALGEMTREELDFVVFYSEDQLLCFDCDPVGASLIPDFLAQFNDGDEVHLGGEVFVGDDGFIKSASRARMSAHASARAPGLSSSTYLNRNTIRMGVSGENREYGECPECKGLGWTNGNQIQFHCPTCNGDGEIVKALFLPLWLVNGVRDNA